MTQNELNDRATGEVVANLLQELRDSFAPRSDAFFGILAKKIIEKDYNGRQLRRGITHVTETCEYNQLSIAKILDACKDQSPERYVEYSVLTPSGSWQTVTRTESAYERDCSGYGANEKPRFIKYID